MAPPVIEITHKPDTIILFTPLPRWKAVDGLIGPYPTDETAPYRVSRLVISPGYDGTH